MDTASSLLRILLLGLVVSVPSFSAESESAHDTAPAVDAALETAPQLPQFFVSTAQQHTQRFVPAIAVTAGTLGVGANFILSVSHRSNLRLAFNTLFFERRFEHDKIGYNARLGLRSFQTLYDYFLFGSFRISPGIMLYNGNHASATLDVPLRTPLSMGDETYTSNAANPLTGTARLSVNNIAPVIVVGFGNFIPRRTRKIGFSLDAGVAYHGVPKIALNMKGGVCDQSGAHCVAVSEPTVRANILLEEAKLNRNISPFRFYPIVSFGVGYKF